MSTSTYPFGADHDDRDLARVRGELTARQATGGSRPHRRFGFLPRTRRTAPR
jgi:hypothetical protein